MTAWEVVARGVMKKTERMHPTVGPGQLLVRVTAVSLNYRDLLVVRGQYDPRMPLPRVPGSDCCAVVVAGGPDTTLNPGDRVIPSFHSTWFDGPITDGARKGDLGGSVDGVLQEEFVVDERAVVRAPDHLTDVEAACLPCAGVTAWRALKVDADLQPGQTVLTLGTGGVSVFATQIAVAMGARVAITSSSDDKLATLREMGAEFTVNYQTNEQWGRAVRDWSPADVVVELGGAGTLDQSLTAVATGGHIALIGVLDGVKTELAVTRIVMRAVRVQGVIVGSCADLQDLCDFLVAHPDIKPIVHEVYPFERADEALSALARGEHIGKIAVSMTV